MLRVNENRIRRTLIVLILGFCCGPAISPFISQVSLGQSMSTDATNTTLTLPSIDSGNTYNFTNQTSGGQTLGDSGQMSNASEIARNVLANKSLEASIVSDFLESGNLDAPLPIPNPLLLPTLAFQLCSAASNPCVGTDGDDEMTGDDDDNEMYGKKGEDLMYGKAGSDTMEGNEEYDQMYGEDGNDFMIGGPMGDDFDFLNGGNNDDWIFGVYGNDHVIGEAGDDVLSGGQGMDGVYGGIGNDVIGGGDGDDGAGPNSIGVINGFEGNDYVTGGLGADRIFGGEGDDTIFHGVSESTFSSTPDGSRDIISCGPGWDRVWASTSSDGDTVGVDCEVVHFDVEFPTPHSDQDGIPDKDDNCKDVANPDQLDSDDDGKGDKCDADDDNDHKFDGVDNCGYRRGSALQYNPDQRDVDHDGIGDPCDLSP